MRRLGGFGVVLAVGLAGCAKPHVAVVVPPPAPVGHPYHVLAQVPAAPRPLTAKQQEAVQQAFNVIALKSSLMVAALSCNQQDKYDAFMTAFQPHVLDEQHVMDSYFKRIGGHYGQSREDDFVTLMANNQSVVGIGQGAVFCLNNTAEFQQVLALKTPEDLDNYVTDQAPAPDLTAMQSTVQPTVTAAAVHRSKKNKALKVADEQ